METTDIFELAFIYRCIYLNFLLIVTLWYVTTHRDESAKRVIRGSDNFVPTLIICIAIILFIGTRPISFAFTDTALYGHLYENITSLAGVDTTNIHENEGFFTWLMLFFNPILDASGFMMVVAIGYIGFTFGACKSLMPNNVMAAVLINLASFSYYSYGTNGIRNGLACAMVMFGIALMSKNKRKQVIGIVICILATLTHHSTTLPFLMSIISLYAIRNFKTAYSFWIASIVISLILGNSVANLFAAMGFDDRLSGYLNNTENPDQFSHTGFRWDFLLYSAMPIVLGYYVIIKRGIRNRTYEFLLNTYILSNAFWVMVIRAAFSNRFAYLSWFLYPIVIAYPLLRLPIWKTNQGKRLNQIMMANLGFTYIMWLLGK